jgi:hypothetical protein
MPQDVFERAIAEPTDDMFDRPGGNPAARFICATDEKSHAAEPPWSAEQSASPCGGWNGHRLKSQEQARMTPAEMLSLIANAPAALVRRTQKRTSACLVIQGQRFMRWRGRTVSAPRPALGVADQAPLNLTGVGEALRSASRWLLADGRPRCQTARPCHFPPEYLKH